jgi:hypothetical protein
MARLFFANLPHDCSECEVEKWMESQGFTVKKLRIVRDFVSRASPAFAYVALSDERGHKSAQSNLDGKMLRDRRLVVKIVTSGPTLFPVRSFPVDFPA